MPPAVVGTSISAVDAVRVTAPLLVLTSMDSVPQGFTSFAVPPRRLFRPMYLTSVPSFSELTRKPPLASSVNRPTKVVSVGQTLPYGKGRVFHVLSARA